MIAAIYSRKSKFTGKGESIENQVNLCKEYALHNLRDKNITEFLVYEDEGFSGGSVDRPEFKRLINDIKLKKIDIIICYKLDRISRNVSDFSNTIELLNKYNVGFISIKEQFDTSTPMGRAMMYISSVFAQLERETIAERVRDNMLELAKTGRWLGGSTPMGYESKKITYIDENMKERSLVKLKQVPEELEIIKLIFNKYLYFKSLSKVETYLLQKNIKTKRGSNFSKSNLRVILNNPVYVKADNKIIDYLIDMGITVCGEPDGQSGLLTYNKQMTIRNDKGKAVRVYRDIDDWVAAVSSQKGIIEANDWLEVQKILSDNKDKFPNQGKTHNALLTGILRCSKCDSPMQIAHGHISKKTGKKIYYYTCPLKKISKGVRCNNRNAKVEEVDKVIIDHLKELPLNKKAIIKNLLKQNKKAKETTVSNREESIKNEIAIKEKQIDTLLTKLSIDDDVSDLIIAKIKKLKNELNSLKVDLLNVNNTKTKLNEVEVSLNFIELLLDKCSIIDTLDIKEKKQIIDVFVTNAEWNGDDYFLEADFLGSEPTEEDELKKK
ncbi:recombinase family protein [Clostridium botulinum]|uniref:recombinase family protein n=1 Tax=Clostridium botulinum TaxID=1491 RepID=UPI003A7F7282